jgi:hypothetical protein
LVNRPSLRRDGTIETFWTDGYHMTVVLRFSSFELFAPLADVAKGGDGAKSAFRGYLAFCLSFAPWEAASFS